MSKNKRWTHSEIDYLHQHAGSQSIDQLSSELKRPVDDILQMCLAFKIKINRQSRYKQWTSEEIEILKTNYYLMADSKLALLLKKTRGQVWHKAKALGLKKGYSDRIYSGNELNNYWKPEEDQFIKDNYQQLSIREVGRRLNRGRCVVVIRYKFLGLESCYVNNDLWTKEEENYFLSNWPARSIKEIANQLGKTYKQIKRRVQIIEQLKNKHAGNELVKGPLSESEKQFIIDNAGKHSYQYIAAKLNRTHSKIERFARKIGILKTPEEIKAINDSESALSDNKMIHLLNNGKDIRDLIVQSPDLIKAKKGLILLNRELKKHS